MDRRERRRLTHVSRGGRPRMVDVSDKPATARRAVAEAVVTLEPETLTAIIDGPRVKGVDRSPAIRDVRLLEKSGGKSGEWRRPAAGPDAAPTPQKRGSFRKRT